MTTLTDKQWAAFLELKAEVECETTERYNRAIKRIDELCAMRERLENEIADLAERTERLAWETLSDNRDVLEELGLLDVLES